jgi:two-component system heavy metal sensor histidine kinase CusS
VDSLLFLARSEHQALAGQLQRQPLAAADELARQADYFADLAEERGLRLACRGDAPLLAEPAMLRRALANLIANALRHARPGSVIELSARTEPGGDGGFAVLEVTNEGEPLPAAVMARLFDRFYRADDARQADSGSSGLGLAIVRAILALHGGTAEALQPVPGRITFRLRLPLGSGRP